MTSYGPPHPSLHSTGEGIVTGLIGAAVVAIFYLVIDMMHGHALLTPSVLGQAFILHTPITVGQPDTSAVVAYTVFHFVAFALFGILLATLTRAADKSNIARYAEFQLLVCFVVFFYGVISVASEVVRGMLPFIGVITANLLAGAAMVAYLWRRHPALAMRTEQVPLGNTDGRT